MEDKKKLKDEQLKKVVGGVTYVPPIPNEIDVKDGIRDIIQSEMYGIDIAIELMLYCMKTQIFIDGNKKAPLLKNGEVPPIIFCKSTHD